MARRAAHQLKIGDRVRVIRLPPIWKRPDWHVPADTRRIYRLMISRRRAVRVYDVDRYGAWVRLIVRARSGRIHHHSITLDDGCWVRVKHARVN
jgi:hypothetical protein